MEMMAAQHALFVISFALAALTIFTVAVEDEFRPMKYRDCKSKFQILSVETSGCGKADRCRFARNTEPRIRVAFKPDRTVSQLKTSVWAHLGDARGALTPFRLTNDNACVDSNITCPLEAGKTYYYIQSVQILPEYPTIDLQVNWLLTSADDASEKEKMNAESGAPPANRDVCIKFLGTVTD